MIRLEVKRGELVGKKLESSADAVHIGRAEGNDLLLPDELVSSDHARIVYVGDRYVLRDQRSTNGTAIVRGAERIVLEDGNQRESTLLAGDVIELGSGDKLVTLSVGIQEEADESRVVAMRRIEEMDAAAAHAPEKDTTRLRILYEAQTKIGAAGDLNDVLLAISDAVFEMVPKATHVSIILRDEEEEKTA